eukprot:g2169.t1
MSATLADDDGRRSSASPSSSRCDTPARPVRGEDDKSLHDQLSRMTVRAEWLELENRRLKQELESMHIAMELRQTGSQHVASASATARTIPADTAVAGAVPETLAEHMAAAHNGGGGDAHSSGGIGAALATSEQEAQAKSLQYARTQEELNMVKALLLIQNVDVHYSAHGEPEGRNSDGKSTDPNVISLSGNSRLLNELMGVRKQVRVLKHCCYILRAQVLQLQLAVPQTINWVMQSAKGAISHESQRSRQLEIRLAKLRKLLT